MADAPDLEGWQVPQRLPMIVAGAVPLGLLALLGLTGWLYDRELRPQHHVPITAFPAPGIETFIHDGARDPHRPHEPAAPDRTIEAAKRAQVAAGWR